MVNASLPLLVVFGLDYTFWPYWIHSEVELPFTKNATGVFDADGDEVVYYKDVPKILETLTNEGVKIAIASCDQKQFDAAELVKLFGFDKYISYQEIYPANKAIHLERIHKKSGIPYAEMLFFDDMPGELYSTDRLGVAGYRVPYRGLSMRVIHLGIRKFVKTKEIRVTITTPTVNRRFDHFPTNK